ncbi:hypothetical protein CC79DRAFT_184730 [Sarocladium strictum]
MTRNSSLKEVSGIDAATGCGNTLQAKTTQARSLIRMLGNTRRLISKTYGGSKAASFHPGTSPTELYANRPFVRTRRDWGQSLQGYYVQEWEGIATMAVLVATKSMPTWWTNSGLMTRTELGEQAAMQRKAGGRFRRICHISMLYGGRCDGLPK